MSLSFLESCPRLSAALDALVGHLHGKRVHSPATRFRRTYFETLDSRLLLSASPANVFTQSVVPGISEAVVQQTDGKILAAGISAAGGIEVARYNADGSLDASFGSGGVEALPAASVTGIRGIYLQGDGSIDVYAVVNGYPLIGSTLAFAHLAADGTPDASYGQNGMRIVASDTFWNEFAVQSNGDLLVSGNSNTNAYSSLLERYNPDGTLDTTFNGTGSEIVPFGGSMTEDSQGRIVIVAGYSQTTWEVTRYENDGTLDTSFGQNGVARPAIPYSLPPNANAAVTTTPDGKIVIGLEITNPNGFTAQGAVDVNAFLVARLNSDGSLDTSFNGTGFAQASINALIDSPVSVLVQANDDIVITGSAYTQTVSIGPTGTGILPDILVVEPVDPGVVAARFTPDGGLDAGFGAGGVVFSPNTMKQALSSYLQSDGQILIVGEGDEDSVDFDVVRLTNNGSLDSGTTVDPNQVSANFQLSGTTLTVISDTSHENLLVVFSDATDFTVTLAGVSQSFTTAQVNKIVFAGADSSATAAVVDAFNTFTTANLTPSSMTLVSSSYEIDVTSTPTNTVTGTVADTASLTGGAGNDRFYGYPTTSILVNTDGATSYTETVNGFGKVTATAGSTTSTDTAYLYDGPGSNSFYANIGSGMLFGTGYSNTVNNFPYVFAYATSGTNDKAGLIDSPPPDPTLIFFATPGLNVANASGTSSSNIFESHQGYSVFYGQGFYDQANGFLQVSAEATNKGDLAFLTDSTGDSRFYGHPYYGYLANTDAGSAYGIEVDSFAHVGVTDAAPATAAPDTAYLYDTQNGHDRFYGYENKSYLVNTDPGAAPGTNFYYQVNAFASVFVPSGNSNDTAYLYDSPGNDTFDAFPDHAIMFGSDFYHWVGGFGDVFALSSGGSDTANLFATGSGDTFSGFVDIGGYHSVLQSASAQNYYLSANNFAIVNVAASAGNNSAYLSDSPGNDTLTSANGNQSISLQYPANGINLTGFAAVLATSLEGGSDTAPATKVKASDYVLQTAGNWLYR
jgi:uncharacterized delta-60 repeat protein